MARLIDADALKQKKTVLWDPALGFCECVLVDDIDDAPTAEVVPCKECRHYDPDSEYCGFWGECRHPEHYCGEGDPDA